MAAALLLVPTGIIGLIAEIALLNFDLQKVLLFTFWFIAVALQNLSVGQSLQLL